MLNGTIFTLKNMKKWSNQKKYILIIFLFYEAIRLISAIFWGNYTLWINTEKSIGFTIFCLLTYFSLKNNKLATLILGTILVVAGGGLFLGCIFLFAQRHGQVTLQLASMLIGIFFVFGGVKMIMSIRADWAKRKRLGINKNRGQANSD